MPKKVTQKPSIKAASTLNKSNIKVFKQWTVKCQLGNFEAVEITEGIEVLTDMASYLQVDRECDAELIRRLGHTGKLLLTGLTLPNEGRSVAGQLAFRLKDGKVTEVTEVK